MHLVQSVTHTQPTNHCSERRGSAKRIQERGIDREGAGGRGPGTAVSGTGGGPVLIEHCWQEYPGVILARLAVVAEVLGRILQGDVRET
jgi:hypothetical protein